MEDEMQIQPEDLPCTHPPGAPIPEANPASRGSNPKEYKVAVEVCLLPQSTADFESVEARVSHFLHGEFDSFTTGDVCFTGDDFLERNVRSIRVCSASEQTPDAGEDGPIHRPWEAVLNPGNRSILTEFGQDFDEVEGNVYALGRMSFPAWNTSVDIFAFQLNEEGPAEETTEDDESTTAYTQWELPAREFDGLWESLIYDTNVQKYLMSYAETALLFATRAVDSNLISWNKVVLLHGPPGTGKTSLCKALSHKLSIRMSKTYPRATLLEINSHSLFSKWFSESGKLVSKLFAYVNELVEDSECLVCILIDEVESLASARSAAASGSEPSDSVRVVNALLTQIDQLKYKQNVIVLTTSNITQSIDLAFVDRADIRQFIGLPCVRSRYSILLSCMNELQRVKLVAAGESGDSDYTRMLLGEGLWEVAKAAEGFSGRALRKLPFQAYARLGSTTCCPLAQYMACLREAIAQENINVHHLNKDLQ